VVALLGVVTLLLTIVVGVAIAVSYWSAMGLALTAR